MKILKYCIYIILLCPILAHPLKTQTVRGIRDEVGYCWDRGEMGELLKTIRPDAEAAAGEEILAGISPHDDYLYAGRVYYPLYEKLNSPEVVIFGVTHGTVRKEIGDPREIIILDSFSEWKGVGRNVRVSKLRNYIASRLDSSFFRINDKAHELEHSIEAQIPFLQYRNPEVSITPIMVTSMSFERMELLSDRLSEIISDYARENGLRIGRDIFILISSDANHYGADFNNVPFGDDSTAHREATRRDKKIAEECLSGLIDSRKIEKFTLEMKNVVWCGKYSIPLGLLTSEKVTMRLLGKILVGKILLYSDTFTEGVLPLKGTRMGITAPFSLKHWCGFLSASFRAR